MEPGLGGLWQSGPRDLPLVYEVKGREPLFKGSEYSESLKFDKIFFSEKITLFLDNKKLI